MKITISFFPRAGAALLLLLAITSCARHSDPPRDTAAAGSAAESSRATRPGDEAAGEVKKTADPDPNVLWSGESGGYALRWLKSDLRIGAGREPNRDPFSLADSIRREWADDDGGDSASGGRCAHESSFRPLSVVGSIVSVERADYVNCPGTAHPSVITWYSVIDAANPRRVVALNELFPERDIFAALMEDAIVRKTLAKAGARTPGSLPELLRELAATEGECEYAFTEDMLAHFAFHHLEGDKVAVRIGLSHGVEACRGKLTQLGLLLPVPASLASALKSADAGSGGYVMRDLKKIAGDAKSTIADS